MRVEELCLGKNFFGPDVGERCQAGATDPRVDTEMAALTAFASCPRLRELELPMTANGEEAARAPLASPSWAALRRLFVHLIDVGTETSERFLAGLHA